MEILTRECDLTDVDLQLLQTWHLGADNKQVAREFGKRVVTVRTQLSAAFQRIGVVNRMQAAFWFRAYVVSL